MLKNDKEQSLRILKFVFIISLIILPIFSSPIPIEANGYFNGKAESGIEYDQSKFGNGIGEAYGIFSKVAFPCAAISFAMGAFKMITGDDKQIAEGKKQLELTLLALIAILLLPLVVKWGVDMGRENGWVPTKKDTGDFIMHTTGGKEK